MQVPPPSPANGPLPRDSEALLRLPVGVARLGSDGVILSANLRLVELFGIPSETLLGRALVDLADERDHDALRGALVSAAAGLLARVTIGFLRADGAPLCAALSVGASEGGFLAVLTDISEHASAAEDLRWHERQFRAVSENALDVISRFDSNLRYVYVNPAIHRVTGYPPSAFVGRTVAETSSSPEMRAFWTRNLTEAFRRGTEVTADFEYDGPDGRRYYQTRIVPEFGENDAVLSCLSVARDVTDARRAEERQRFLAEAGELLSASLDYGTTLESVTRLAVPRLADYCVVDLLEDGGGYRRVAVAHTDPERERLMVELRSKYPFMPDATYGVPAVVRTGRSEMEAETLDEWLVAAARDEEHLRLMHAVGMVSSIVVPLIARGRTLGAMSFLTAESGRRYCAADLALSDDLARRCALAIDNARLYLEMQEMSRAKDEFLAMLSHELRNPLGAICNALHALDPETGGVELAEARPELQAQVQHMTRLVNDLLDVARITHGRITLRRERVDLRQAVNQAIQPLRAMMAARNQTLTASLPDEPVELDADPVRLHQIIANLLHNAAKYTHRGGEIRLNARVEDGFASVTVEDNGVGISVHLLPRVFNVFSQGDRTLDRAEGGLGIGLSLVKSLVELHGGTVTANSDGPGCGSSFEVRLPIASERVVQSLKREAVRPPRGSGRTRRVLVVEDNAFAARMLARIVASAGHAVFVAHSGPEAIELARVERPDTVLLDIGLPGLDGYEVARQFRADDGLRSATLVALTGYGRDEDRERARRSGFDHHLVKPVDFDALLNLLA
ncbi:MAG TPA: ATP-binding protein [Armatimonadota bacterium]|jgi:PAS domain S-box-containing protein